MTFSDKSNGYGLGSLKETLMLSLPLMLTALTLYLIYVVDRFILACHSLDALNAGVQVSALTWAIWGGITIMAGMSEISIAQCRLMQALSIGKAIWNSIWLCVLSCALLTPIAIGFAHRLYPTGSTEYDYFFWSMVFGVFQPLSYALSTFFVGLGKTRLVLFLSLATVVWNGLFDYLLIFGIPGWIPSLGAKGVAIAGGLSLGLQTALLLLVFLRKKNRRSYGTGDWKPDVDVFIKSMKIAGPMGILYNLELWGWSIFYTMMAKTSSLHITISSLCQSVVLLFTFISEGLYRGTLLQANKCLAFDLDKPLKRIFNSALIILCASFCLQILVLLINPKFVLNSVSPPTEEIQSLLPTFTICAALAFIYVFFQGMQWILSGFLCAVGQTLPVMVVGSCCLFGLLVFPTYFMIQSNGYPVEWAWILVVFYTISCCSFYALLISKSVKSLKKRAALSGS
jgi:MATE family multidrug resistance protein